MKKIINILFCCLLVAAATRSTAQSHDAAIHGKLSFLKDGDSIQFVVHKCGGFFNDPAFQSVYYAKVKNSAFFIKVPVARYPEFLSVIYTGPGLLEKNRNSLIIETGDDVSITENAGRYQFSGKGSAKYNMLEGLQDIYKKWHPFTDLNDPNTLVKTMQDEDRTAVEELHYLDSCKTGLDPALVTLVRENIISHGLFKGAYQLRAYSPEKAEQARKLLREYKPDSMLERETRNLCRDTAAIINTQYFLGGTINKYRLDSCFMTGRAFDVRTCYNYLKGNYSGIVREALITWLIIDRKKASSDIPALIADALKFVKSEEFTNALQDIASHAVEGARAYDFELTDEYGRKRSFNEFKGKVVLLDFWYTGCPSCAQTAPYLEQVERQFQNKNVVFITINTDKDPKTWLKSLASHRYTSDATINFNTGQKGSYHPVVEQYHVNAYPALILIGKNGRLCGVVGDPRNDKGSRLLSMISAAL